MSGHTAKPIEGPVFVKGKLVSSDATIGIESVLMFIQLVYRSVLSQYLRAKTQAAYEKKHHHWLSSVFVHRILMVCTNRCWSDDLLLFLNIEQLIERLRVDFDSGNEVRLNFALIERQLFAQRVTAGTGFLLFFKETKDSPPDPVLQGILREVVESKNLERT